MRNEGGGFAANIYGAMPESSIQVTSHKSLCAPNPHSLTTHHCFQTSGLACGACRPLIICERGEAGSTGSEGRAGGDARKFAMAGFPRIASLPHAGKA